MTDNVLNEAARLFKLGFAIHWLRPKTKIPLESGWTTGPRKGWDELRKTYRDGYNVGVRLGTPSLLTGGYYLAVIDVDVKSDEQKHRDEAISAAKRVLGKSGLSPTVKSGRGRGSRHFYFKTRTPFKTFNFSESNQKVRYFSPSKAISKIDRENLTEKDLKEGYRIGRAWEVSLYSDGRQVVLPPSVHPDTGELYRWGNELTDLSQLPLIDVRTASKRGSEEIGRGEDTPFKFKPEEVELSWLPIDSSLRAQIETMDEVLDRSAFLLKASKSLLAANLSENEILSILTDPKNAISECAYEHAKTNNRSRAALWVKKYSLDPVVKENKSVLSIFEKKAPLGKKLTKEEIKKEKEEHSAERDWREDIVMNQQGKPFKTVQNIVTILENELGKGTIRRNLFAYRDEYHGKTPWGRKKGDLVDDEDVSTIKYWLGCKFEFEPNTNLIQDALIVLALRSKYDPVLDWLGSLKWDGKKRLDTWLKENFGAKGNKEYLAQVFRKWMVAMVTRAYEPGTKFDWLPIFEGPQGIGKSSFGRLLVGDKYFSDGLGNLHDKDASLNLQGIWCVELGELSQLRKTEIEHVKLFLSRSIDKLRPPYGRRTIESPRRCVFFGTTNHETYLSDKTGNRRFKPVVLSADKLSFEKVIRDREQLFAEAKALYEEKSETTFELTGEALIYEAKLTKGKIIEDDSNVMEEIFLDWRTKVESGEVTFDFSRFCILDLFNTNGCFQSFKKDNRNFQFASKMLQNLGAEKRKVRGRSTWGFSQQRGGGFQNQDGF